MKLVNGWRRVVALSLSFWMQCIGLWPFREYRDAQLLIEENVARFLSFVSKSINKTCYILH